MFPSLRRSSFICASFGFVTGGQAANTVSLAAARLNVISLNLPSPDRTVTPQEEAGTPVAPVPAPQGVTPPRQ